MLSNLQNPKLARVPGATASFRKGLPKRGLQARFTEESLAHTLQEPQREQYFQLLALLDFERLLRQAGLTENSRRSGCYLSVDIHGSPSLISLRAETEDSATAYNMAEKRRKHA